MSIGTITGGISVNTVPDECVIEIDRRLLPGEDPEQVRQQIIDYVAAYPGVGDVALHDEPFITGLPLSEEHNGALGAALCEVARSVTGKSQIAGVSYGTDAAAISACGVPSVVFGPGSIDQAHTCDEWLDLKELELASEALYQFGRSGL